MIFGITEDFSSDVVLDSELKAMPESGLMLNSGVHPSITIENLLSFLPDENITIAEWDETKTYSNYSTSKQRTNLVLKSGNIYQSLKDANTGQDPEDENSEYWMLTNFESLKLKNWIDKVKDRVYSDLSLTKRLINNQFIYEVAEKESMLPNNYAAWVFEPKGSDYVKIRLNQVSLQKSGTTPINLYVINQGVLIDTLEITPNNGAVKFNTLNYSFKGQGKWIFAIDSTEVFRGNGFIDPLQYDGFVCYTATGTGDNPETAKWSYGENSNGLGFNVSVSLESSLYIDNNLDNLGNFVRAVFEYMTLKMFLSNSSNRSNRQQVIQLDKDMLIAETTMLEGFTVAKNYMIECSKAKKVMNRTFDTQLLDDSDESTLNVTSSSV